jgi:hypothetical protein
VNPLALLVPFGTAAAGLLVAFALVCVAGYVRGHRARRPGPGVRPATPHAGFATPDALWRCLSERSARRAGAQVRPGLVVRQREPHHDS